MATGSGLNLSRSGNDTSVLLDLLRAVAAQMVCVGHAIAFFMPQFRGSRLPLMQNVGVLLFFALSGFVITYTLVERSRDPAYGFGYYLVDRVARIYSGLLPCLVVIFLIDFVTVWVDYTGTIAPTRTISTFLANLFMLEGYRGPLRGYDWMEWSIFGSASPIWTLAIEWHIYLFVGAVFFIGARPRSALLMIPIAVVFGGVPLHYAFGAADAAGVGSWLFTLWLGGACIFLGLRDMRWFAPAWLSLLLAVAAAAGFIAKTHARGEYDPAGYPLILLVLLGLVCAGQRLRLLVSMPRVVGVARFAAGYSFTLYLIHYTVMEPLFLMHREGWGVFLATVVGSNVLAVAIAMVTEMRHREFARLLYSMPDRLRLTVLRERAQNN